MLPSFSQLNTQNFSGKIIFLDIDGTITSDGKKNISPENKIIIEEIKKTSEVYLCSNHSIAERNAYLSKKLHIPLIISSCKKPNPKVLSGFKNPEKKSLVVIGDKYWTDGRFAKNIGAEFVKVKRITSQKDSFWIQVSYFLDDMIFGKK